MHTDSQIFERNMLSLSLRHKDLVIELTAAQPSPDSGIRLARTGLPVPVLMRNNREFALHSLFDPEREGLRYAESIKTGGYVVVFGIGAFYHVKELLNRNDISGILLIDKDIGIFKSVLMNINLSEILADPRISILLDPSPESILEYLPAHYLPAVSGDFQTLSLRSRTETEKEYFNLIFNSIKNVMDTLSDDYTVQTYFGKRWFENSIANLEKAERSTTTIAPASRVAIAAAGPSLESQIKIISGLQKHLLISTDTALPCLLKNGIKPDLVISIDCQQITYHHFMHGYPEDIPLVLDLASPRALTRLTDRIVFFTSGHPFSLYANRNWRRFPSIDTSGGNVSHAAISLAERLGAREIRLFGADFSYPQGKSYARGTYVYPYFYSRSGRLNCIENQFYSFLYRNDNITMIPTSYGYRYTTRPMLSYKERLERFAASIESRIIPEDGLGEYISIPERTDFAANRKQAGFFSAGSSRTDWRTFLCAYRDRLTALPEPTDPPSSYFSMLDYTDKDVWTTLFPVAAVLRKKYRETPIPSSGILKEVRQWALSSIEKALVNR